MTWSCEGTFANTGELERVIIWVVVVAVVPPR